MQTILGFCQGLPEQTYDAGEILLTEGEKTEKAKRLRAILTVLTTNDDVLPGLRAGSSEDQCLTRKDRAKIGSERDQIGPRTAPNGTRRR